MGRKKENYVYHYFDYDEVNKRSKCLMENCGQVLRGYHGANLLRHFYTQHRIEYDKIQKKNSENKENVAPTTNVTTLSLVIDNCTNLVAVHGRPFSILEDEAFKNIISMIPDLKQQDCSLVNVRNVKSNVQDKAYEVRRKIHDEIKNKFISLKIDVASVKSRRFLGVNIQYILNDKIIIRNLGVFELHGRNTAVFLKESVILIISRYGIELNQLYSVTTDNGANMLSMSRQLEQDLQASFDTSELERQNIQNTSELPELEDHEEDVEFENLDFGETGITVPPKLIAVRCAAHTLQLAVRDASSELVDLFEHCRRVACALRSPNNALLLRENNLPQAIIDCPTRWDSTADMIERILMLKDFLNLQADPLFQILNTDDRWRKLEECLRALTPCRILSKNLQKEQLTIGDFYISWVNCIFEIDKLNTAFALFLIRCMKERENALMNNDCVVGGIYLDPRVNSILTDDQLNMARDHLLLTYQRAIKLTTGENLNTEAEGEVPENVPSTSTNELDLYLQTRYRQRQQNMSTFDSQHNLQRLLIGFLNQPLLASNTNILQYWSSKKVYEPQLYLLSTIVLATPLTQVSVERLFSSLKFVMSNLRMSLKDEIIDDILVIRNNALYNKKNN